MYPEGNVWEVGNIYKKYKHKNGNRSEKYNIINNPKYAQCHNVEES